MPQPLSASATLLETLQRHQVRFAHWKSNLRLGEGLAGGTDLDLLVVREDTASLRRALHEVGCLQVVSPPWAAYPDVEDWLALDDASGRLLHLHVHYRMVTGLKRVKHLRLPWEAAVLADRRTDPETGWPVPSPELELLVLLVRVWAKMPPWRRLVSPKIPDHVREELRWLVGRADMARLASLAAGLGLRSDLARLPLSEDEAVAVSRRLYLQLRPHYRMDWPAALARGLVLELRRAATGLWLRSIGPVSYRKTLAGGGAMVALLGSDGSGKSTLAAALGRWLAVKLDVHLIYMGSGDGAAGGVNWLKRRLAALWRRRKARKAAKVEATPPPPASFAARLYRLLDLHLLRRKLRRLRRARRLADEGSVILIDRYPQSQFEAISDGPRQQNGRGFAWAARSERALFEEAARIGPDLVIKLAIDPATAHRRKPDHDLETIRRKCEIVDALSFPLAEVVVVDAARSPEKVLAAARGTVWRHLARAAGR